MRKEKKLTAPFPKSRKKNVLTSHDKSFELCGITLIYSYRLTYSWWNWWLLPCLLKEADSFTLLYSIFFFFFWLGLLVVVVVSSMFYRIYKKWTSPVVTMGYPAKISGVWHINLANTPAKGNSSQQILYKVETFPGLKESKGD